MANTYDLIILGGGPAGVTAGIYAARQHLNVLLVAKSFGGQMARKSVDIENYPGFECVSGLELIQKFENHLRKQKIDIEINEVASLDKIEEGFKVITKDKKEFRARALIVATGSDPRHLDIPGEKEFTGRGVSYCPICDGPVFSGKKVAIVGGGNSALEAAIFLSNYVQKIYILERGEHIGGDSVIYEKAAKMGKTEIITNVDLKGIKGDKFVDSIIYQDIGTKEIKTLQVGGIFVEIGNRPATSFIKGMADLNEKGEIIADPKTAQTKTPGLFSAGDVDDVPYKQIVIAAGEGAKAALSAYNYLQGNI
ncbi:MAG: FAD-dependent oxidoreductase [Patescibacteria group bacterium]